MMLILQKDRLLVSGALNLLLAHFSQRKDLMAALSQVQLLVTKSHVDNYHQIKQNLEKLRNLVEKSELWVYKNDTANNLRFSMLSKHPNLRNHNADSQASSLTNEIYASGKLHHKNSISASSNDDTSDFFTQEKKFLNRNSSSIASGEGSDNALGQSGGNLAQAQLRRNIENQISETGSNGTGISSNTTANNKGLVHRNSSIFGLGHHGYAMSMVDSVEQQENYKLLSEILKELIKLCSTKTEIQSQQRLLRNLSAHEYVLELLKIPYDKVNDFSMKDVMKEAHTFLQKFVNNNAINQKLLHKHQNLFVSDLDERNAKTLTSIYHNNMELCFEIDSSVISQFVQAIEIKSENKLIYW